MQTPTRKSDKIPKQKPNLYMTKKKHNDLKKDLAHMLKIRPRLATEVKRLAELGDFSENAEYQLAKGRLRGINNRITKLEFEINHADIIEHPQSNSQITIGHFVRLSVDGEEKEYQILGSTESNPNTGIISQQSPIGSALLGKKKGDIVSIIINKKPKNFQILDIK